MENFPLAGRQQTKHWTSSQHSAKVSKEFANCNGAFDFHVSQSMWHDIGMHDNNVIKCWQHTCIGVTMLPVTKTLWIDAGKRQWMSVLFDNSCLGSRLHMPMNARNGREDSLQSDIIIAWWQSGTRSRNDYMVSRVLMTVAQAKYCNARSLTIEMIELVPVHGMGQVGRIIEVYLRLFLRISNDKYVTLPQALSSCVRYTALATGRGMPATTKQNDPAMHYLMYVCLRHHGQTNHFWPVHSGPHTLRISAPRLTAKDILSCHVFVKEPRCSTHQTYHSDYGDFLH